MILTIATFFQGKKWVQKSKDLFGFVKGSKWKAGERMQGRLETGETFISPYVTTSFSRPETQHKYVSRLKAQRKQGYFFSSYAKWTWNGYSDIEIFSSDLRMKVKK